MSDQHQSYGDDGPAYGDDGPAYGDDGPAYSDHGPAGSISTSYDGGNYDDVSYGDESVTNASDDDIYRAYDEALAIDDEPVYSEEQETDASAAQRTKGSGLKLLGLLAAAGLGMVGVGAAGYFFLLAPGTGGAGIDPTAMLQSMPVIGGIFGTPAPVATDPKANASAVPVVTPPADDSSLFSTILNAVRGPARDSDIVVAALEDNITAVARAIDTYVAGHHSLPSTSEAILQEVKRMNLRPANPFRNGEFVKVELGAAPTAPGNISYLPKAGHYELRIGNGHGQTLMLNETALVLEGPHEAVALDYEPAVAGDDAASAAPDLAGSATVSPKPLTETNRKGRLIAGVAGIDKLGTVPAQGASAAVSLLNAGTPPPLPTVRPLTDEPGQGAPAAATSRDALTLKLKRNREFDYWRVKGIGLIYSARTEDALDAFKKALEIHPNDDSVTKWVIAINAVLDKSKAEADKRKSEILKAHGGSETVARVPRGRQPRSNLPPPELPAPPTYRRPAALPPVEKDDASKMFDELRKADKVPLLAPPKLDP